MNFLSIFHGHLCLYKMSICFTTTQKRNSAQTRSTSHPWGRLRCQRIIPASRRSPVNAARHMDLQTHQSPWREEDADSAPGPRLKQSRPARWQTINAALTSDEKKLCPAARRHASVSHWFTYTSCLAREGGSGGRCPLDQRAVIHLVLCTSREGQHSSNPHVCLFFLFLSETALKSNTWREEDQ